MTRVRARQLRSEDFRDVIAEKCLGGPPIRKNVLKGKARQVKNGFCPVKCLDDRTFCPVRGSWELFAFLKEKREKKDMPFKCEPKAKTEQKSPFYLWTRPKSVLNKYVLGGGGGGGDTYIKR